MSGIQQDLKIPDVVEFARRDARRVVSGLHTEGAYELTEYTFGALVPDREDPLCNVAMANCALTINFWVGCAWQCAYCHVQGSLEDLNDDGVMPKSTRRRTKHSIDEVIDALIAHPFFSPNQTVLSLGGSSTEPLAPGHVVESTFDFMEALQERGYRNPFWIVTKRGMPAKYMQRLERICKNGPSVLISVCWAGNPVELEPVQNNRFVNARAAHEAGATIDWYLRPLAPAWGTGPEKLEEMIREVGESYGDFIHAVVPGALRWTEGVDRAVRGARGMSLPASMQEDATGNDKEDLPQELAEAVLEYCAQYLPGTPVYFKSSCAQSHMMHRSSLGAVDLLARHDCEMSRCPASQRAVCSTGPAHSMSVDGVQRIIDRLRLPLRVLDWDDRSKLPHTVPPLERETYAISQMVENSLNL